LASCRNSLERVGQFGSHISKVSNLSSLLESERFVLGYGSPVWAWNSTSAPVWTGAECQSYVVRVRAPVRREIPGAAYLYAISDEHCPIRLHESPLLMPDLGPRIRKEASHAREGGPLEMVFEHLHRVTSDHPDVRQPFVVNSPDEVADAGRVHVDCEESEIWLLSGHLRRSDASPESDLKEDRSSVEQRLKIQVFICRQEVLALGRQFTRLPRRESTTPRLVRANRRVFRLRGHERLSSLL